MTTKELLALVEKATPGPWEWINSNSDEPFDFDAPWDGGGYPSLRTVECFGENKTEVRDGGTYTSFALPKWILDAEPMQNGNDAANAALIVAAVNALPALCAEVEALRKDAERYRWLRDNKDKITMTSAFNRVHGYGKFSVDAGTFDTLDAAIDAAKEPK